MKIAPFLLAGSLALNAAIVGAFFFRPALAPAAIRGCFQSRAEREQIAAAARVEVEKQNAARAQAEAARTLASQAMLWSALKTDDLPSLIAKLRAAGFPPSVVRAIVNAQVEARFAARMKQLTRSAEETPYWKPNPGGQYGHFKYYEEMNQLYRERMKVLRDLLGDDFFAGSGRDPTVEQRRHFGNLSKAKIELIQRINDDYGEMISQVRAATNGITLPEDREKMALLNREKRADLAAILTPQELEDYEMRSSPITSRLSTAFKLMDATENEFLTIFKLQQRYEDQINPNPYGLGGMSAAMRSQSEAAQTKLSAEIKAALGDTRAAEFQRAQNYEYQQLVRLTERDNLPISAATRAFDLRASAMSESIRIYEDKQLTVAQKQTAMQTLAQNTKDQLISTLGANLGGSYAASAYWLQAIKNGTAIQMQGSTTMYRSLSSSSTPANTPSTTRILTSP